MKTTIKFILLITLLFSCSKVQRFEKDNLQEISPRSKSIALERRTTLSFIRENLALQKKKGLADIFREQRIIRFSRENYSGNKGIHLLIDQESRRKGIDPDLIRAIVRVESNFKVHAKSKAGALGLMQLMPSTAQALQVKNVYNARENIQGGVRFFSYLLKEFDDTNLAIAAYNAGPEAVKRYNGVPPFSETQKYLLKVKNFYAKYRRM
ncbi:MAG: transglycosylase SLT domain-containing protein [Spirochaetota bacterium]